MPTINQAPPSQPRPGGHPCVCRVAYPNHPRQRGFDEGTHIPDIEQALRRRQMRRGVAQRSQALPRDTLPRRAQGARHGCVAGPSSPRVYPAALWCRRPSVFCPSEPWSPRCIGSPREKRSSLNSLCQHGARLSLHHRGAGRPHAGTHSLPPPPPIVCRRVRGGSARGGAIGRPNSPGALGAMGEAQGRGRRAQVGCARVFDAYPKHRTPFLTRACPGRQHSDLRIDCGPAAARWCGIAMDVLRPSSRL